MESSGRAVGEGSDAGFWPMSDIDSGFRLNRRDIIGKAEVHPRRRGANRLLHRHALDDRMVIRPGDVEAL